MDTLRDACEEQAPCRMLASDSTLRRTAPPIRSCNPTARLALAPGRRRCTLGASQQIPEELQADGIE